MLEIKHLVSFEEDFKRERILNPPEMMWSQAGTSHEMKGSTQKPSLAPLRKFGKIMRWCKGSSKSMEPPRGGAGGCRGVRRA